MNVQVQGAQWGIDAVAIVDSIDLHADTGEFIGVIGPNGSGKSSLLRLIYRMMKPDAGFIALDERDIWAMSARETAQAMAVVAQERASDFDFTVEEVVMMGRTPHKGLFDGDTAADAKLVNDALRRVGVLAFAERTFSTLSGGEKQRVLVARALAQCAKVLILDEPTNHLDIRYQFEILELVRALGITVIAALHDLNMAACFCDRLYLLDAGKVVAQGKPETVLTSAHIERVYRVFAEIETRISTGKIYIVFNGIRPESSTREAQK